jgi:VIT1/CCC1 family predicted Fe2+/Mn2+ transporter
MTETHFKKNLPVSDFTTDLIIGMSEGLTILFALTAGLSGAVESTRLVVIVGLAGIAAGSLSMALGRYFVGKTDDDEYHLPANTNPTRARKRAFNIGGSYIVGGLIPITSYFFVDTPVAGLKISAAISIIFLFFLGYFKSKTTGENPVVGAIRLTLISIIAAGCAYAIARLISNV